MKEQVRSINVSLYPRDWAEIDRVSRQSGLFSRSGALRLILQQWRDLTQSPQVLRQPMVDKSTEAENV